MYPLWYNWPELKPGNKQQGYILAGESHIPATALTGLEPGPTVFISAGIHGCEYPGIIAAQELSTEFDPTSLSGRVLILAPVNVSGFRERLSELTAEDGKNINRLFPGNAQGSPSERLAAVLTSLQVQADFYLDLHSGDLHESLRPFVFFPGVAEPEVVHAAREAAKVLDVDIRVRSSATTGAYNSAAIKGVPSLLIERGGQGAWSRAEVDAYKRDIRAVLAHLGSLPATYANSSPRPQREVAPANYLEADREGCWFPAVEAGQLIRTGDLLGSIKDIFGTPLTTYHAERDGEVLYMTISLAVKEGAPLVAYG